MKNLLSDFNYCFKKLQIHKKTNNFLRKIKLAIILIILILFPNLSLKAQETGPLLMKQELGYTLGGSVLGSGLGVIVWFMDPLNPSVTLKSTVQNGFVAGTALGALFGFYMLQNAIVIPQDKTIPENLDQLLSDGQSNKRIHKSIISNETIDFINYINFTIFEFRF